MLKPNSSQKNFHANKQKLSVEHRMFKSKFWELFSLLLLDPNVTVLLAWLASLPSGQSSSSSWFGAQWGVPSHLNSMGIENNLHWNSSLVVVVVISVTGGIGAAVVSARSENIEIPLF